MSDKLLTFRAEDFRIEPQEVRVGTCSYMKGQPPFEKGSRRILNPALSKLRNQRVRLFEVPSRPYIFSVGEIANLTAEGIFQTTPTPDLIVMCAHASKLTNGLWIFADGIPVVEGVRTWNQAHPQEMVNLVVACQEATNDPTSIDFAPFAPAEEVMSVYAGPANAAFGLTDTGRVLGIVKVDQIVGLGAYLARLPTFTP